MGTLALSSKGAASSVANAVNDNPGRVRAVEDYIGVRTYREAAEIAFVGGASAVWMISE